MTDIPLWIAGKIFAALKAFWRFFLALFVNYIATFLAWILDLIPANFHVDLTPIHTTIVVVNAWVPLYLTAGLLGTYLTLKIALTMIHWIIIIVPGT